MSIEISTEQLTAAITNLSDRADSAVARAVFRAGAALQTLVRAKASSAHHPSRASYRRGHIPGTGPGPNVFTGDYVRSVTLTTGYEGTVPVAIVSTNDVRARALEYGRPGHQAAYPHWRPAAVEFEPQFQQALRDAIQEAVNGP